MKQVARLFSGLLVLVFYLALSLIYAGIVEGYSEPLYAGIILGILAAAGLRFLLPLCQWPSRR